MVPFAGHKHAFGISGVKDEHINVRTKLGVFDVSHMGEFWVKGPKALSFAKITSNDVAAYRWSNTILIFSKWQRWHS